MHFHFKIFMSLFAIIFFSTSQSDKDKDGRLSLQEMITDPYVFYSSIFEEEEDDDYPHTEFRWGMLDLS